MNRARLKTAPLLPRSAAVASLIAGVVRLAAAGAGLGTVAGEADFALAGKNLHVTWSEPRVVAVADRPEPWGFFQFPKIARTDDGALFVHWAMNADSITAYGKHESGWCVSRDGGRNWIVAASRDGERFFSFRLPDGDRLAIYTPPALKAADLKLPPPAGSTVENYTKATRRFYSLAQLPAELQGVYLERFHAGGAEGTIEHESLEDPGALRYELQGLVPVVWWGDLRLDRDGSLVAGVYPGYYRRADGSVDVHMANSFYRSTDAGRSWKIIGHIAYEFDSAADPKGAARSGFTEPAFEILRDGTFLCVMRSTDGAGIGPLYASASRDHGATWSKPAVIAPNGVLPQLLRLQNGVLVLASGRPGVQLRFATDPAAAPWTAPLDLLAWETEKDQVSCGYTGLVALGPDRFALVYSDFRHRLATGEIRKAIEVREFSVTQK